MPSLALVGSRHWADRSTFVHAVECWIALNGRPALIVTGDATGADAMARDFAREHSIPFHVCRADWPRHGASAGPIRNRDIVRRCTHMIAFCERLSNRRLTPGTASVVREARRKSRHVELIFACSARRVL